MLRRPRKIKQPSSGHYLVELVLSLRKRWAYPKDNLRNRLERARSTIAARAGVAGADWAIDQLSTLPARVAIGWPAPYRRRKVSR
jgi:hypothetical protein